MRSMKLEAHERPRTLAQDVTYKLREKILKRELKAGDPLRQDSIANSLGTSIIPVREAFRQLEAEGLVESRSHRGVVVTSLTLDKAREWIHMRRLIETDLLGLAIDKMTDDHIKQASHILKEYDEVLDQKTAIEQWSNFNWEFHAALLVPANRPETMQVLSQLHDKCDRYIQLQLLGDNHIGRAEEEHSELLELCRNRRKRDAKAMMNRHIAGVENDLIEQLGSES